MTLPTHRAAAVAAFALALTGTSAYADRCTDSLTAFAAPILSCLHVIGLKADGTVAGGSYMLGYFNGGRFTTGRGPAGGYACTGSNQLTASYGAPFVPGQWFLTATPSGLPAGVQDTNLSGTGVSGPDANGLITHYIIKAETNPKYKFGPNCRN